MGNTIEPVDVYELPAHWRSFIMNGDDSGMTDSEVELATAEWVDWFNHRRLYEYCGDAPPAELEAAYYARIAARQPAELTV